MLWGFLSSLGVDPSLIPEDAASRAGLFRSLLAEKGAIIFLDNAHDEKQVRPLLPGNKRCAVLITSRPALSALEGALPTKLGLMPFDEALDLLAKMAGDGRVQAEDDAARRIVELCGRLPLAIRIAGGKLRDKEHWTLARYADLLEDEKKRLERLHLGDLDVRASFELSYMELGEIEARIFRRLSLLPGQDFEPGVGGAMLEIDKDSAFEAVERLVDLRLIEPSSERRYQFHDLMCLFAREKAKVDETAEDRKAASLFAVRWYVERSGLMNNLLKAETRHKIAQEVAAQRNKNPDEVSRNIFSLALAWFEREDANLLESVRWAHEAGSWDEVYELAGYLVNFFHLRSRWIEVVETQKLSLEAARRAGNKEAETMSLINMATIYGQQGRWDDAIKIYGESLNICRDQGDKQSECIALMNMGIVYRRQGQWDDAIEIYEESLNISRNLGDVQGEGQTLMNMGIVYRLQGRLDDATKAYGESLEILRGLGDRHNEAIALTNMGNVYRLQGRLDDAAEAYEESLNICRDLGDRRNEGIALANMGNIYRLQGRLDDATKAYEESLKILRGLGDRNNEGQILMNIGLVYLQQDRWDEAIKISEESLKILRDLGDSHGEGMTLANKGLVYFYQGLNDRAVSCWEKALTKLHPNSPEHKIVSEWLQ